MRFVDAMVGMALPLPDVMTAAAESTHNHPTRTESASCSICVAAHSTQPTASSSQARPVFTAISLLREEEVIAKSRFVSRDRGIRGPPAAVRDPYKSKLPAQMLLHDAATVGRPIPSFHLRRAYAYFLSGCVSLRSRALMLFLVATRARNLPEILAPSTARCSTRPAPSFPTRRSKSAIR